MDCWFLRWGIVKMVWLILLVLDFIIYLIVATGGLCLYLKFTV